MSSPESLYEPKLVNRWAERYRNFETEEMVRSLRRARRKAKQTPRPNQTGQSKKPGEAA